MLFYRILYCICCIKVLMVLPVVLKMYICGLLGNKIFFMILLHFNSCKCREIIVYMYWGKPDIFVVSFMVCLAICHLSRECRKFVNWFPSCKLTISNQRSSSIFAVYRRIIKKVLGCFVWQLVSKLQFICIEETSQTDLLL